MFADFLFKGQIKCTPPLKAMAYKSATQEKRKKVLQPAI